MSTAVGYCWPQSVLPGDDVALHLSSEEPRTVQVRIVRDGLNAPRANLSSQNPQMLPDQIVDGPDNAPAQGRPGIDRNEWRNVLLVERQRDFAFSHSLDAADRQNLKPAEFVPINEKPDVRRLVG